MSPSSINDSLGKNRIVINVLVAFLYSAYYNYIYSDYIVSLYGSSFIKMSTSIFIEYLIICTFPIVFFKGIYNLASLFSIFNYVFVYIPFMETLYTGGYGPEYNAYKIVFLIFTILFFATDNLKLLRGPFKKKGIISFRVFEIGSLVLLSALLLLNIRNLHFTNFVESKSDLYDLRSNLSIVGGSIAVYFLYWLKCAFLPCLLVYYLRKNNLVKAAIAFVSFILLFMLDQQKITFFIPFLIILLFALTKWKKKLLTNHFFALIVFALVAVSFVLNQNKDSSPILYELAAIFIMRIQCIEGMELNTYLRFFGSDGSYHPYTHYSHIGIVNSITGSYPYDMSLGHAVTYGGANANGCFWLMDGIAADGIVGCIIISVVFLFIKALFNSIGEKYDSRYCYIIFIFAVSMMMNVSIFTALLTCGLIALYLILALVDLKPLELGN